MPLQINTVISRYNIDYLEEMAHMRLQVIIWNLNLIVYINRKRGLDINEV